MGAPQNILSQTDGGLEDYQKRWLEEARVLGEGEFGVVKMVHDTTLASADDSNRPYACKILRKGYQYKDNVIYSPIKPDVLRGEVEMLRALQGRRYCLELVAVYESPRQIHMILEFCAGGEMMEYFAVQKDDLRTEDVSRIAFQLLSAVDHCARNRVMHRDIKPENGTYILLICCSSDQCCVGACTSVPTCTIVLMEPTNNMLFLNPLSPFSFYYVYNNCDDM